MNKLFYGDNLRMMREFLKSESVDLVYLDPPFNSKRDYNLLYKTPDGEHSASQVEAFKDTWVWGLQAEREYHDLIKGAHTDLAEMIRAFRLFMRDSDLFAYLVMMASRLLELKRIMKPTASLYLHCDPVASHYLKILLDYLFGAESFKNEIIWKRQSAHSDAKRYGSVHDTVLFYSKNKTYHWQTVFQPYSKEYMEEYYRYSDPDGRKWMSDNLSAAGLSGGGYEYDWKGVTRIWRCPQKTMEKLEEEGKIFYTKNGIPRRKRYLDEQKGMPAQDVWDDVESLRSWHKERLGYPTQKPLALLERIIQASSNPGDVVLDPFCGCGTAVHAAEKLDRQWVGIDITHLAISLIEKRLQEAFPNIQFEVVGRPTDLAGARDLAARDKHEFQRWACWLVDAQTYQGGRKGPDGGIDGLIYFMDADAATGQKQITRKAIVSVKGGQSVTLTQLKDLMATVEGNQADIGLFVSLAEPTAPMKQEAAKAGFYTPTYTKQRQAPKIQLLTIEGLLEGREKPDIPDMSMGQMNFRQAEREITERQVSLL